MKTIIQISDTHLMQTPDRLLADMNPEQSFHAVVQQALQHQPIDCFVHTGDLAQEPSTETYQRYLNYMYTLGIPFYQTAGNHDDVQQFPFPQQQDITTVDLDEWCIILLNSAVTGRKDGQITSLQIEQLSQLLKQHQHQYILLGCHHHPVHIHSEWIDHQSLKEASALLKLIEQHNHIKAFIHGHVHQENMQYMYGIPFFATPSTCVQFKPKSHDFMFDQTTAGYRVLKLYPDGNIQSEVQRLPD